MEGTLKSALKKKRAQEGLAAILEVVYVVARRSKCFLRRIRIHRGTFLESDPVGRRGKRIDCVLGNFCASSQ